MQAVAVTVFRVCAIELLARLVSLFAELVRFSNRFSDSESNSTRGLFIHHRCWRLAIDTPATENIAVCRVYAAHGVPLLSTT